MVRLLIFTHVFLNVENVSDILDELDTLSCYFDPWKNLLVIIPGNTSMFTDKMKKFILLNIELFYRTKN